MGKIEIEAKPYLIHKIFAVIVPIGIITAVNYHFSEQLFQWNKFNPNGIITILFIAALSFCIFSSIKLLDNGPKIKINKQGFFLRKSFIPFSPLQLFSWAEIEFITLESEKQKNITSTFLTIKLKMNSTSNRIDLDNLDQPTEDILSVIRNYSTIINYRDRSKI